MKVIKRSGVEVDYDAEKIRNAILAANNEVPPGTGLKAEEIDKIVDGITELTAFMNRAVNVEEIQDTVEQRLMWSRCPDVARKYIRYRYDREKIRNGIGSTIDSEVLSLVEYENEEVKQENSNKNPEIIPTQRDYIAGTVSKDLALRLLLPPNIAQAHKDGVIHVHDTDYLIQHSHNCDLVNLDDMLQMVRLSPVL